MNDTQRIQQLERELGDVKAELARLTLAVRELTSGAESRRESTQTAVNGIQKSLDLIFQNVKVPNVTHTFGVRYRID